VMRTAALTFCKQMSVGSIAQIQVYTSIDVNR
jgi:hypothetical protein